MFFGEMNIPRGNGTKTQYIFRNGNVEYKVFTSNQHGTNTFNFSTNQNDYEEEEEEEEIDDINFGNDLFNHIFNNERRKQYKRSHNNIKRNQNRSGRRTEEKRSGYGNTGRHDDYDLRNQFSFLSALTCFIQLIIMFFVVFALILPFILPRIFRFR